MLVLLPELSLRQNVKQKNLKVKKDCETLVSRFVGV
jgi:hypothetical protein